MFFVLVCIFRANSMKKLLIAVILTFTLITSLLAEGTLVSAVLITRHGDRTPFDNIVNANYQWGTDLTELTPIGMHQEFMLGAKLRKHYIEELKFLDDNYKANTIYTLSSNSNRTILSAECVLMGLYPPGTGPEIAKDEPALPGRIQTIPVRSLPDSSSVHILAQKSSRCHQNIQHPLDQLPHNLAAL